MLKFMSSMLCTSKIHPFPLGNYLGTSLVIGNLMRIRVISVEWTWLGLVGSISKLQLGDDEMSIETYIQMQGEEITELELNTDELVDVALGTTFAQDLDFNVILDSEDVDDVALPTVKLSDGERHASLLSSFYLKNTLYFGVNVIISF